MIAHMAAVAGVQWIGGRTPQRASSGSRPLWSMCAWLSTTASSERGSKPGRRRLPFSAAGPPWNIPKSSSTRARAVTSRCALPVTPPAAPWNSSRKAQATVP
jgi:hypothetical protein